MLTASSFTAGPLQHIMDVFTAFRPLGEEIVEGASAPSGVPCFTIQSVDTLKFASDSQTGSGNLVFEADDGDAGRWLVKELGEGVYGFSNQRTQWWISARGETGEQMRGDAERWRLDTDEVNQQKLIVNLLHGDRYFVVLH